MTPTKLGRYDIRELLGGGAMGLVYRAHDPGIERDVALKTIRPEILGGQLGDAMLARFRNEAMSAGRLSHPGIVTVYEFGMDGGVAFIAMELAPGVGLSSYVKRRGGLGMRALNDVMGQLLDALSYAHVQGVVHRDIKPPNLLVSDAGRLKITDFGIARFQDTGLTEPGGMVGTPNYMAPEQFMGQAIDRRVDIYAAGMVLYELLVGHTPFAGNIAAVGYQVCFADIPPPSASNPHVSSALDAVVARATARNRDDRFASAREFADALNRVAAGAALARPSSPVLAPGGPGPSSTLPDATALGSAPAVAMPASRSTPGAAAAPVWSAETLKALEDVLASFVGPIARVLVKRGAAQAREFDDLCARLAASLASDDERARFLKQAAAVKARRR